MSSRAFFASTFVLGLVTACGGGEDRKFGSGTGGAAGSGAAGAGGGATGGSSGTGATGGGGAAGSGGAATGGSAGAGGATGGAGGATGGAGGATGGTGGAATCESANNACLPNAPAGWTGPMAFRRGQGAPPACPGAYPTKVADGHAGLDPGTPSCKCTCDPATGIQGCNGTASIYDVGETTVSCFTVISSEPKVWTAAANQCVKATLNSSGQVTLVVPNATSPGTCAAKPNHTVPTPTWAENTRTCSGATPAAGACGAGETCMPKTFAPYETCIYSPGDVACPTTGYTKKLLVYEGFTDGRTCSACSCGTASSTCKGSVTFASACSGLPIAYSTVSGCGVPSTNIATTQYGTYTPAPSGTCPPSTSALSGAVATTGESTVCCLP